MISSQESTIHHEPAARDGSRLQALLESASARTEEKFLLLGSRLGDFHRRSREVARQAQALSGAFLDSDAVQAVSGLRELVQGLARHRQEIHAITALDRRALREIDRLLENLFAPVSGFRKIIKTLQSLGIATRIESSQTAQQDSGFLVFADELKELSGVIDSRSTQVLGQLRELRQECRTAWEKLDEVQAGQGEESDALLHRAQTALQEMEQRTRLASGQVESISGRAAGFAASIGEVVASIQFQDIVRQKVTHVQQALADVESARLDPAEKGQILALQAAQLDHARSEMDLAVAKIVESLRALALQIGAAAEQARKVAGSADSADSNLFREFEAVIGGISLLLQEGEKTCRESVSAVATVAAAIDEMAGMLDEIEFLGEKMKVVALNAGIRAAHVGRQGAALGVIAESIQQMSAEALVLTRGLAVGFREIMTCARALGEGEKNLAAAPEILLQNASALLRQLQAINRRQVDQLQELDLSAAKLAEDLQQVAKTVDLHATFARDIEEAVREIKAQTPAGPVRHGRETALFRELMERYTMHSEREIHRGQEQGLPGAAERKVIPFAPRREKKSHDLGDNVELF